MALQVFQVARAGLEGTRGSAATPTRLLRATEFRHEQTITTIRPEELRNNYEGFFTASTGVETNTFGMSGRGYLTDLIWLANMFIAPLGTASGTATTAYTWTFTPSGTADNVKTATVQMGYADTLATVPGVQLSYLLGDTLNLHWEKNDDGALTFDANFMSAGTATQITSFTGAAGDDNSAAVSMFKTVVTLDASTIGTTTDSNVIAVDWTVNLNPVPLYTLDNTAGAKAVYRPQHRTWTATITRQYANDTEWDIYQSKAERKVRVLTVGGTITSSGTFETVQLDLYGVYTGRTWADVDGIITEQLTLEPIVDAGAGTISHKFVVVNPTFGTLT